MRKDIIMEIIQVKKELFNVAWIRQTFTEYSDFEETQILYNKIIEQAQKNDRIIKIDRYTRIHGCEVVETYNGIEVNSYLDCIYEILMSGKLYPRLDSVFHSTLHKVFHNRMANDIKYILIEKL